MAPGRVPYSQTAYYSNQYGRYRQDCSGFTSMAWALDTSYTTASLPNLMHTVNRADLQMGDALWKRNGDSGHVALFMRWADAGKTQPVVWEEWDFGQVAEERVWSASYASTFTPKRYNNIVEDGPSQTGSSLSGDGRSEIVRVLDDGQVKAWRNGRGFAEMPWDADTIVATGMTDQTAHFADLDGDGDKEIITVLPDGQVKAWRNGKGWARCPGTATPSSPPA
ncbi:VCBS repeat-containing protein [Lentzea sp. PSKA42]|uniref:VCBS repeat-containing protein n=1 Tax=Lentzea indica TaxID=2604800 RepID=A0ABX1FQ18_9PSEU|nr:VCBS repeat-containing protein [Lentzea indica]NKE61105.1 VCBS repeat-containing protein [Lentzea indica]